MTKLTPQEARIKQAKNLKAAVIDMPDRINAVTDAPGKKAAAKEEKMLKNLTEAVTSGRWAKNVGAVSLESWKADMINKGLPRIASGIDAAADKVESFMGEFFPHLDRIAQTLDGMPDLTLSDSIARMTYQITEAAKFKRGAR